MSLDIAQFFNPFMCNAVTWPNILLKSCGVNTARFLKCVWPFCNIMHQRVNMKAGWIQNLLFAIFFFREIKHLQFNLVFNLILYKYYIFQNKPTAATIWRWLLRCKFVSDVISFFNCFLFVIKKRSLGIIHLVHWQNFPKT